MSQTSSKGRITVFTEAVNCPPFVVAAVFDDATDSQTHTATFTNGAGDEQSRTDTETSVRMAVDSDGGVVTYDDGTTIRSRVCNDPEQTVELFRGTVDSTVREYDTQGIEYEFSYDPGSELVEFSTV